MKVDVLKLILNPISPLIDLLLYGNFWIAAAASAMCLQTQWLLTGQLHWNPLVFFVFSATLCLYALHRIVGLQKVKPFQDHGRYLVIARFKYHILVYAILGLLGSAYFFFQLQQPIQLALVLPSILSIAYVIPILGRKRRLRDFHFIKIFLIALVWAWITVGVPGINQQLSWSLHLWLMTVERALFIFAITLPFDIRDLQIDQFTSVKTLPQQLGVKGTKWLALTLLTLAFGASLLNYQIDAYTLKNLLALTLSYLLALACNLLADRIQHDYFFTGLVDGLMLIQCLLILFL
ncbi:MAG: hypothetical protein AAF798_02475 [Bacteroidota bacterium]